jgi:hypothetical protein
MEQVKESMRWARFFRPSKKPKGLMKPAYYFTRRQFGKVRTPLKVHSASGIDGFVWGACVVATFRFVALWANGLTLIFP